MTKKHDAGKDAATYPEPRQTPRIYHAAKAIVLAKEEDPNDPEVVKRREDQRRRYEHIARQKKLYKYKYRLVACTTEDEQAFTDLLKKTFPGICIVSHDDAENQKLLAAALQEGKAPQLQRFDSLADPDCLHFFCWLEPEDWQPIVEAVDSEPPRYRIVNLPRLRFEFLADRGVVKNNYYNVSWFREIGKPLPPIWSLDASSLEARYHIDDREHQDFLRKAYRLITGMASNRLIAVDEVTGRARTAPTKRGGKTWVCTHALAWCREHPGHMVSGRYRPADEYDSRSKIPETHPDYLTGLEGEQRFIAWLEKRLDEFDAEFFARRKELAEQKKARDTAKKKAAQADTATTKNNPAAKTARKTHKPAKKKRG